MNKKIYLALFAFEIVRQDIQKNNWNYYD